MLQLALEQIVNGLLVGMIYTMMALGLMVVLGILNVINMAQGEFYMLGGYFSFVATAWLRLDYLSSIAVAMLATAAVGIVVERIAVRPFLARPSYVAFLSTLAVSMILVDAAQLLFTPEPQAIATPFPVKPIVVGPLFLTVQKIVIFLIAGAIVAAFAAFLKYARLGMAVRALAKDRDAALLMGIDANGIHTLTFAIGAALAGAAGALVGAMFNVYPTMGELPLLKGFSLVIMGGLGSVGGVLAAGLILGVAEGLTAGFVSSDLTDLVAFVLLIAVLLARPQGLSGRRLARA
jgi:branched-subunit amino acid ABC-type transport system permease component